MVSQAYTSLMVKDQLECIKAPKSVTYFPEISQSDKNNDSKAAVQEQTLLFWNLPPAPPLDP